jgi:hypothetical protein
MRIAVFGSREGVNRNEVIQYLTERFDPSIVLVSGGAYGVDAVAEGTWLELGGSVESYRPTQVDSGEWSMVCWMLTPEKSFTFVPSGTPTFEDFRSAAFYRNMVIAEVSDRGVGFIHNGSGGSTHTADCFKGLEKPCSIHAS